MRVCWQRRSDPPHHIFIKLVHFSVHDGMREHDCWQFKAKTSQRFPFMHTHSLSPHLTSNIITTYTNVHPHRNLGPLWPQSSASREDS